MLKPVKADTIVKALAKIGFISIRQHGSHLVMKHPDGRITVVPMHKGERTWNYEKPRQRDIRDTLADISSAGDKLG